MRKAARALTAFYDQVMAPTGLRATQGTLLVALARAGDIPVSRLAGILGMDRTTLTRNLAPLERDRLVTVRPGEDRRVKLAGITEKGRKTLAAARRHSASRRARKSAAAPRKSAKLMKKPHGQRKKVPRPQLSRTLRRLQLRRPKRHRRAPSRSRTLNRRSKNQRLPIGRRPVNSLPYH